MTSCDGHLVFDRAGLLLVGLCHLQIAEYALWFVLALDGGGDNLRRSKVGGRIRNGSYEKDGERVYTVDLLTEEFHLLAKHQQKGDADRDA